MKTEYDFSNGVKDKHYRAYKEGHTVRRLNQFTTGFGDYTKERGKMFDKMELDQVITEIKAMKNPGDPAEKE